MIKETLYEMKSPTRDDFKIQGYWFGEGEKTLAIVGAMRGDEIQQQYICARMVERLKHIEETDGICHGKRILVIPSCNPFSMNVGNRFWTMDGTDINRMFPGYDQGETTQRIAAALFTQLKDFKYGIQMASFYMPGDFIPHVRILSTGYEDLESGKLFGMPYVTTRKPRPYDTTLLNYNWQVWGVKAYSIYAGQTHHVAHTTSEQSIEAILRFMQKTGIISYRSTRAGYESEVFDEEELINISAHKAGIFDACKAAGEHVKAGELLARILDPYDCGVKEEVKAPADGTIFFVHNRPLALEHTLIYRLRGD
ncbi:MAG: M14 family metallopeptidase [Prevotella sp.]